MYFIGMLEKILLKPEVTEKLPVQNAEPVTKILNSLTPTVKKEFKPYDNKNTFANKGNFPDKKPTYPPKTGYVKKVEPSGDKSNKVMENCFGLFAKDNNTFDAMYSNQKVIFKLAGIPEIEVNKQIKNFLTDKVKKKVLYLTFKSKDDEGNNIVEVFEDKSKQISINKQLLENFDFSIISKPVENVSPIVSSEIKSPTDSNNDWDSDIEIEYEPDSTPKIEVLAQNPENITEKPTRSIKFPK